MAYPQPEPSPSVASAPKAEILIAEPDRLFGRVLATKLSAWGYHVDIARTGEEAYQAFMSRSYRVVMTEMVLPDGRGADLCRQLRDIPRSGYTYLICFGSKADKAEAVEAFEAGADDFVVKPLHIAEVRARLDRARRVLVMDDAMFRGSGTDPETGIVTAGAFRQFFRIILAQTERTGGTGTLLFLRLANSAEIQRQHGFQAVHGIIIELSRRLQTVHRSSDLSAKTADDEFCLLLQNTRAELSGPVIERVAALAADLRVLVDDVVVRARLVMESVDYPQSGRDADNLLGEAPRQRQREIGRPSPPPPPTDEVPLAF